MLTPLCFCLSVHPSVSVGFCLPLYLSLSISMYVSICLSLSLAVSICLSLYLSVSLCRCVCVCVCVCVCLCLCFCLSPVIWFRHEFISVCVSGEPDSTDHRADFLTFYFFNEDITYALRWGPLRTVYPGLRWGTNENMVERLHRGTNAMGDQWDLRTQVYRFTLGDQWDGGGAMRTW